MLCIQKLHNDETKNSFLRNELEAKRKNPKYRSMCEKRKKLPSYGKKDEILELIRNNQVILISGETGVLFFVYYLIFIKNYYLCRIQTETVYTLLLCL